MHGKKTNEASTKEEKVAINTAEQVITAVEESEEAKR